MQAYPGKDVGATAKVRTPRRDKAGATGENGVGIIDITNMAIFPLVQNTFCPAAASENACAAGRDAGAAAEMLAPR